MWIWYQLYGNGNLDFSMPRYCKGQVIVFWYNKVKPPFLLWIHVVRTSHWFIGFISKASLVLLVPITKESSILFFRLSPEWECDSESIIAQSRLTLCDLMDCSPPGSSGHGLLQARIWSVLLCPPPEELPTQGSNPSPVLQADSSLSELPWNQTISCRKFAES